MAEIRPFAALRYADGIDLAAVTCPPYDVLSPAERQALQDRSPYAAARVILPNGEGDSRYSNAAALLEDWEQTGKLKQDETPALYVTRTTFIEPGSAGGAPKHNRLGLVCLMRLYPYADRVVLPHERTLSKPKEDRLKLLRATRGNVESIMTLVDDEQSEIYALLEKAASGTPLAQFDGDDDQTHTLYRIDDATAAELMEKIGDACIYIADGHHRYETSVAYAEETGTLGTDAPEAFLLTTLSSMADPGLCVLPTHRLVKDTPKDLLNTLFSKLEPIFDVRDTTREDLESRLRLTVANQPVFGLALPSGHFYQLTLRSDVNPDEVLPADIDPSLRSLEVVLLQYLVLEKALGIPAADVATTDRLAYTRSFDEAVQKVHDSEFDIALLLGRPAVTGVRDVSLANEVMPQKSTFFYPKLVSGLVLRKF